MKISELFRFILGCVCCACCFAIKAQEVIHGEVYERGSREALIGANILVKGTSIGTTTEWDGSFLLRVGGVPVALEISYTGFESVTVEINDPRAKVIIELEPIAFMIETVQVVGSRISDKRKESPLTVESLDLIAIKQSTSNDFYEGLGALTGVDLTTASMGFTIINTRGFNSTSPVRSLQIIDGVDNQAPGLNFSLGNFLGAPELDVLKVELIQGASSAFFGPNAFNGVIDIRTKDPFLHQGLSVSLKYGERNMLKAEMRFARAFQNRLGQDKFAFKINGALLRANDWEATNTDPTFQSRTDQSNPGGYDAVNIYGDEFVSTRAFTGAIERREYPGLGIFHRRGYAEQDLVDYKTENYKGNAGLYYNITPAIQLIGGFNFGSGTAVYQGENRFRLKNIFFWQSKLELRQEGRFFVRGYITEEDAGRTYDAYTTALQLLSTAKEANRWSSDYIQYWQTFITPKVRKLEGYPSGLPFNFEQQEEVFKANQDSLFAWHARAQAYANQKSPNFNNLPFFEPGTARFDSVFNHIISHFANDPQTPGTRFYDKSGLFHIHGEYIIDSRFADFTVGANFRQYKPDSRGTIFSDTAGVMIRNQEFGIYAGIDKRLIPTKLKLNATARFDKNENFKLVVSPAASLVYTPSINSVLRLSFSSALRNPTLADQYLYLNVGRAQLLGNISGYEDIITPESFIRYLDTRVRDSLVYFNEAPIQPERVRSIEIGYRGTLFDRLWVDAGYYYSWYRNFIGFKIGIQTGFNQFNFPVNTRVFRISTNATSGVTTQGFSLGASYYLGTYYNLSGNYSWNVLNKKGADDPIIPAYNTPEHKFNIGLGGRGMPLQIGSRQVRSFGFNVSYKWIEGFLFEGSPQFTGLIPTYDLLDAQVNWEIQRLGMTVKIGATNVLNKKQVQTYGGPRIGRLAYLSFLYEGK